MTPEGYTDVRGLYWRGDYEHFAKSKATLLVFRKVKAMERGYRKAKVLNCSSDIKEHVMWSLTFIAKMRISITNLRCSYIG